MNATRSAAAFPPPPPAARPQGVPQPQAVQPPQGPAAAAPVPDQVAVRLGILPVIETSWFQSLIDGISWMWGETTRAYKLTAKTASDYLGIITKVREDLRTLETMKANWDELEGQFLAAGTADKFQEVKESLLKAILTTKLNNTYPDILSDVDFARTVAPAIQRLATDIEAIQTQIDKYRSSWIGKNALRAVQDSFDQFQHVLITIRHIQVTAPTLSNGLGLIALSNRLKAEVDPTRNKDYQSRANAIRVRVQLLTRASAIL